MEFSQSDIVKMEGDNFRIEEVYEKTIKTWVISSSSSSSTSTSSSSFSTSTLSRLEQSSYLERVLLPSWDAETSSNEHLLSICALFVEKAGREGAGGGAVAPWLAYSSYIISKEGGEGDEEKIGSTSLPERFEKRMVRLASALLLRASLLLLTSEKEEEEEEEKGKVSNQKRYIPSIDERCLLLSFISKTFLSVELVYVRKAVLRFVSLPIWLSITPSRVELEILKSPSLKRPYAKVRSDSSSMIRKMTKDMINLYQKSSVNESTSKGDIINVSGDAKEGGAGAGGGTRKRPRGEDIEEKEDHSTRYLPRLSEEESFIYFQKRMDAAFFPSLLSSVLNLLDQIPGPAREGLNGKSVLTSSFQPSVARFCVLFLELCVDLLSQLPTRRFIRVLLQDAHIVLRCKRSNLAKYVRNPPSLYNSTLASSSSSSSSSSALSSSSTLNTRSELISSSAGIAVGSERHVADENNNEIDDEEEDEEEENSSQVKIEKLDLSSPSIQLGRSFNQLVDALSFYLDFEVDDETGKALTDLDIEAGHYSRVSALQSLAYKFFASTNRTMKEFALSATALVSKPHTLKMFLSSLTTQQLVRLAANLRLLPVGGHINITSASTNTNKYREDNKSLWIDPISQHSPLPLISHSTPPSRSFVMSILLEYCVRRVSQLRSINSLPLYPSETLLWDANLLPSSSSSSGITSSSEKDSLISSSLSSSSSLLVLPKLNLQFLTIYDYLLRCFHLYRLESSYSIRSDLVDAIKRSAPRQSPSTKGTVFTGWSKMAVTINGAQVSSILPPKVGGIVPSGVIAELSFDVQKFAHHIRSEWDTIREHDVLFLVSISAVIPQGVATSSLPALDMDDAAFARNVGITSVRGCEVYQILDERGDVFNDPSSSSSSSSLSSSNKSHNRGGQGHSNSSPFGTRRTLRVRLDPAQYHLDSEERNGNVSATKAFYANSFNLLIRRDNKSNNFKAVLQTIRDVMNSSAQGGAVPNWLHDMLLGYGDPADVQYSTLSENVQVNRADFGNTFTSAKHLISCFPGKKVVFLNEDGDETIMMSKTTSNGGTEEGGGEEVITPPFRLEFDDPSNTVIATSYSPLPSMLSSSSSPSTSLYDQHQHHSLSTSLSSSTSSSSSSSMVHFNAPQVEALRSALNPGLTLVVGPPGTGKTDTVVQAINLLYQNFPTQKVLIITHSNQALNDIFEKLIKNTSIPQRHLLRLGSGERELDSENDFTKAGRVQAMLDRRIACLSEVERLGKSLDIPGDVGYTCETASFFFAHHIKARIDTYRKVLRIPTPPVDVSSTEAFDAARMYRKELLSRAREIETIGGASLAQISQAFPFSNFFSSSPSSVNVLSAFDQLLQIESKIALLISLFDEIASLRAFELLRSQRARADYMLTKQARIVAMTCTHASIMRSRFISLDFTYDSLIMEEAAQVLEVETLIPILLQKGMTSRKGTSSRSDGDDNTAQGGGKDEEEIHNTSLLKRVILVGDHNQLPPIVQNTVLARQARLEQSMFSRFIRLGVVPITLSAQGRARPSIAKLYSWRYGGLDNLPIVTQPGSIYASANAGFVFDHQIINVGDYKGEGETAPSPHFYQNLGEAEYVVAVYQYMRLLGYPANSIAILTTYNGQKALIKDVVARRCSSFQIFGEPGRIETVDAFQGQQADYVLLSLVRTKTVGHLRDVRRLIVALSRARLGLYIFCRKAIFANCPDLSTAFSILTSSGRPTDLHLLLGEAHPTSREKEGVEQAEKASSASNGMLVPMSISQGIDQLGEIVSAIMKAQQGL